MRRNIAILLILSLMIGIVSIIPVKLYASDGTHLYQDVWKALGSTKGKLIGSEMEIVPSTPAYAASVGTEIMRAKRDDVDVRDEFGNLVFDESGKIKQKSIVTELYTTTKTTYADSSSSKRYKAIAYTFLLVDPHDHSKVLYSARVSLDTTDRFDDIARSTKAYKSGYRLLYSTRTIPSETLVSALNSKAASNS